MDALISIPSSPILNHHFRQTITWLIQINWQSLFVCLLPLVLVLIELGWKKFRGRPTYAYSRWRMGLLLLATLTPLFLSAWSWVAPYVLPSHYDAPFLAQQIAARSGALNPPPKIIAVSEFWEAVAISLYLAWVLIIFPSVWIREIVRFRRLLTTSKLRDPQWLRTAEWPWERDVLDNLLERFNFWRPIRVVEGDCASAFTARFWFPIVVLPGSFHRLQFGATDSASFRAIVAHEFAHIRYHSFWLLLHRFLVWLFPLPELIVWVFNWVRKRALQLRMDTNQASAFLGEQAAIRFEGDDASPRKPSLLRRLKRIFVHPPDPAALMDCEFELHADFVAARQGGADPIVLKKTLLQALLYKAQEVELARLLDRIETKEQLRNILSALIKSGGLFTARHPRFLEYPADHGVSLFTKVIQALGGVGLAYPMAIAMIPVFIVLVKTGSEMVQPPKMHARLVLSTNTKGPNRVAVAPKPPPPVAVAQPPRSPRVDRPQAADAPAFVATRTPNSAPTDARPLSTPSPQPQPQSPSSMSGQDVARQMAAFNEQQRMQQENLFRQSRDLESMRRQQEQTARTVQAMQSDARALSQIQSVERTRQSAATFANASHQGQRAAQMAQQSLDVVNRQRSQQSTLQAAERASQIAFQSTTRNRQLTTQSRIPTPTQISRQSYNPPKAFTPPTVYTPPVRTYTYSPPPSTYSPRNYEPPRINTPAYTPPIQTYTPPSFTQPRNYSPPAMPYIPPPPPRIR